MRNKFLPDDFSHDTRSLINQNRALRETYSLPPNLQQGLKIAMTDLTAQDKPPSEVVNEQGNQTPAASLNTPPVP